MKNLIKEYYSALIEKTENYSGEVPYLPEDELLKIKGRIQVERRRRIRTITAAAASVVCVAIGISYITSDKELVKEEGVLFVDNETADSDNAVKTAELPVVGTLNDAAIERVNTTAIPKIKSEVQPAPMYTHIPQITMPPMEESKYADIEDAASEQSDKQEKYYALASPQKLQPEISEAIPAGVEMPSDSDSCIGTVAGGASIGSATGGSSSAGNVAGGTSIGSSTGGSGNAGTVAGSTGPVIGGRVSASSSASIGSASSVGTISGSGGGAGGKATGSAGSLQTSIVPEAAQKPTATMPPYVPADNPDYGENIKEADVTPEPTPEITEPPGDTYSDSTTDGDM